MSRLMKQVVFFAGFVLFFGASVFLQNIQSNRLRREPRHFRDWMHLPSSEYMKFTTLGYDQFSADFLWLRAIQSFGAAYANKENLGQLVTYFNVITDLDPHFIPVYTFGNLVLGEEGKEYKKALDLLDKGIIANPRSYRIPFDAAFFSYWTLNDPKKAKYYVKLSLKDPRCPEYVRGWMGYFDMKMGRYIAAYQNYFTDYLINLRKKNTDLAVIRYHALRRSINDWYVAEIRAKALEFHKIHSRYPPLEELESGGAFRDVELPDWDALRAALRGVEEGTISIPDSEQEIRAIATRFLRKGWEKVPLGPDSDGPVFKGYRYWAGQEPFFPAVGDEPPRENRFFIMSELDMAGEIFKRVSAINAMMKSYQATHDGACAKEGGLDLIDTSQFAEPWGGTWEWDLKQCRFYPSTYPDFLTQYNKFIKQ